eukprot:jgi/Mesvir1/15408/Mv06592-RA.1
MGDRSINMGDLNAMAAWPRGSPDCQGALASSAFAEAKEQYKRSLAKFEAGQRKQAPAQPVHLSATEYIAAQWSRYLSNHKDEGTAGNGDDDDDSEDDDDQPIIKKPKKLAPPNPRPHKADKKPTGSKSLHSSLTNIVITKQPGKPDAEKPVDSEPTQDAIIERLERELAAAKSQRAAAAAAPPTIFITPPLPPASFAASLAKACPIPAAAAPAAPAALAAPAAPAAPAALAAPAAPAALAPPAAPAAPAARDAPAAFIPAGKKKVVKPATNDGGQVAATSRAVGSKAGDNAGEEAGKKPAKKPAKKKEERPPPLDMGLPHFLPMLSIKATVHPKAVEPEIGLFVAQRFLLKQPEEPRDTIIWEFGKVTAFNVRKKRDPWEIKFTAYTGQTETYQFNLNDLPRGADSTAMFAWVALDNVTDGDLKAYGVVKRREAKAKARAGAEDKLQGTGQTGEEMEAKQPAGGEDKKTVVEMEGGLKARPPKAKAEEAGEGGGRSEEKAGEGGHDTEIEGHASTSAGKVKSKKTMISHPEMRQPAFSDPPEPPGLTEAEQQLAKLEAMLMRQKALVEQERRANVAESQESLQVTTSVDWTRQEKAARRRAGPVDESEDSDIDDGDCVDSPPSKKHKTPAKRQATR